MYPGSALKEGLRFLKLNLNNLIVFFQFNFLAKTLVMVSRDEQMDGSFWNVRESVPPLRVCFGAVRGRTVEPAALEAERKSCLTDRFPAVRFFDHHGNAEFRNWLLRRWFRHPAKKQGRRANDNPSSKSQMSGAKHGIITPFHMPFARTSEPTITAT
jgi:hypothetical protein